jgi:uncharacterized membrane protein
VLARPTFGGTAVALVFWLQSLTPTLVPRAWGTQAVISAVCVAVGYALGTLLERGAEHVLIRRRRSPGPAARRRGWAVLAVLWLASIIYGSLLWLRWQNEQHDLMGTSDVGWFDALAMVTTAAVSAAVLVVVGRALVNGIAWLLRIGRRHLPGRVAAPVMTLFILAVVLVLVGALAFRGVAAIATSIYGSENDTTEPGIVRPGSPSVSGSRASLVPWRSLGRTGRDFVAEATTPEQLTAFHGKAPSTEPVRVYVGVKTEQSLRARADLAVRELERAGGFDRKVLAVWVPTGSGWMIPEAAEALEQLYDGDTAIVGMQYSFLPSLFSVFLEAGLAAEAGSILFNAVEARWRELPREHRPKLLLFGKSLGTAGVEAPFAAGDATSSVDNLVARTDGALIVGAKHGNRIMSQLTSARDKGSPVWAPVFDNGRSVRFVTRDPHQSEPTGPWRTPRIVYLQHPSDPVPYWGLDALWKPPEWMDQPRGYDVSRHARWFPIVSAVQAVGDQIFQLSPPPGFGHDYATEYAKGWALVAPPPRWTQADTERLETFLDHGETGESEP